MLDFTKQVSKVVGNLRGPYPIEKVRNVVLSIVFLKYASKKNEVHLFENIEYSQNLGIIIYDTLQKMEIDFPILKGIFDNLRVYDILSNLSESESRAYFDLLNIPINPNESYQDIFNELINLFAKFEGKIHNTRITPESIINLFKGIIGDVESIFDPSCGMGSLLNGLSNYKTMIYGQDINKESANISKLRFAFNQFVSISEGDSLSRPNYVDSRFDAIVATPPFSMSFSSEMLQGLDYLNYGIPPRSNSNMLWIQLALHHLSNSGTAVVLLSNNSLSTTGAEGEIRERLIKDGMVECIISLPSGIFDFTGIPTSIWILSKRRVKSEVLMIDISKEGITNKQSTFIDENCIKSVTNCYHKWLNSNEVDFLSKYHAKSVSYFEIEKNEFQLIPSRYLPIKDLEEVDLTQAIELRNVISRKLRAPRDIIELSKVRKVSIKDLSNKPDKFTINIDEVEFSDNDGRLPNFIGEALLVARAGDKLRPTYIVPNENEVYVLVNIIPFDINKELIHPEYLVQELNEKYVKVQLEQFNSGSVFRSIREADFLSIKINIPNRDSQLNIVQSRKLSLIKKAQQELEEYKRELGVDVADANSYLRHQIAGPLKNLRGAQKALDTIIKDHLISKYPEILELKVNANRNKTFGDYLTMFSRDLAKVSKLVKNSNKKFDLESAVMEDINLIKFVKNYCEELKDRELNIEIELWIDEDDFRNEGIKEIIISGNEELITDVFDNLVENALKHALDGFDGKKGIYFQIYLPNDTETIQVDVTNTGFTVKENFNFNTFVRQGGKLGANAGDGIGGWYIHEIMKKHKGDIGFTDEQGAEGVFGDLASTFELHFPIKDILKNE